LNTPSQFTKKDFNDYVRKGGDLINIIGNDVSEMLISNAGFVFFLTNA